jgi:hypothetical protein
MTIIQNLAGIRVRTTEYLVASTAFIGIAVISKSAAPGRGDTLNVDFAYVALAIAV